MLVRFHSNCRRRARDVEHCYNGLYGRGVLVRRGVRGETDKRSENFVDVWKVCSLLTLVLKCSNFGSWHSMYQNDRLEYTVRDVDRTYWKPLLLALK